MHVIIAPDGMGGVLPAREVADALARGWRTGRPDDRVDVVPMSDGGEGLREVVQGDDDRVETVEVAGPRGHPVEAALLRCADGAAVIESASACGLALLAPGWRDPLHTTTYGVGELLDAARTRGARQLRVGLGGSATVDGGAGALTALGFRLRVADGSGLKVGGADLHRVDGIERPWVDPEWEELDIEVLADVRAPLVEAARTYAPQKGASVEAVERLEDGLQAWERVVARDLGASGLAQHPGTGAAGGLGFGLAAGLGARLVSGAAAVAHLVGLDDALAQADLVVTGEGRVDATSWQGKVVGEVHERACGFGVPVALVAGAITDVDPGTAVVGTQLATATTADQARDALVRAGERLAEEHGAD